MRDGRLYAPWSMMLAALLASLAAAAAEPAPPPVEPAWSYHVKPGDTLWDLAGSYLIDRDSWRILQRINNVAEPRALPPGSTVRIPLALLQREYADVVVVDVTGDVRQRSGDGPERPLAAGDRLYAGDVVVTGAGSSARLRFVDGAQIRVEPESEIAVVALSAYRGAGAADSRLRLERGRLTAEVEPDARRGSRMQVITPAAVTAVRGTRFRVAEGEDRRTLSEVELGQVAVSGSGRARTVSAGSGVVSQVGRGPGAPERLLPAPPAEAIPTRLERHPFVLAAPTLRGAVGWRLRLLPEGSSLPTFDTVIRGDTLRGPDVPDGDYRLVLRGIAASGLEGLEREVRVTVDARPDPPVPLVPPADGKAREPRPSFGWAVPEQATGYRVQVASDPGFATPLLDATPSGPGWTPDRDLATGSYWWRIATIDATGQGPFGDPVPFTRVDPPPPGEPEPPQIEERRIVLRTRAGPEGQRYAFEVARDREFRQVLVAQTVDEPELAIDRPLPGTYWLRIRQVEPDSYQGPWSVPQRLDVPVTTWWPMVAVPSLMVLLALLL